MQVQVLIERQGVAEICKAGYDACSRVPEVSWRCSREGRDYGLCGACTRVWRNRVAADPVLRNCCPNCENVREVGDSALPASRASRQPIQGPVADTIRHAMHMEGILVDKQDAVLRRLAMDAPWLGLPEVPGV